MNYVALAEGARNLILNHVQTNISTALDAVAAVSSNPIATLDNPRSYFVYPKPQGYRLPAVFIVCDGVDFRLSQKQSNFVNASDAFKVSVELEDQDTELLTYRADRYLSALFEVLNQVDLQSSDGKLKLKILVNRASFSPVYMRTEGPGQGGKFRKEVVLDLAVEHLENF